ncbi:MAG: hypothetical protein JW712_10380 [Dehalococcoidales bacterium]|nr:hypothetical protein [Dehalococcoidales bacterium]
MQNNNVSNGSLWYKVMVNDWKGEILSQEERQSHSFLKQWNQAVLYRMFGNSVGGINYLGFWDLTEPTFIDATGNTGTSPMSGDMRMNGAADNEYLGIVIGTGNTPVTITDRKLEAQIRQGFGVGQMDYLAMSITAPVVADPNCEFTMSRQIANSSGALITVRESGIYSTLRSNWNLGTHKEYYIICIIRDVFSVPQDVPHGGGITVEYTLRVTE